MTAPHIPKCKRGEPCERDRVHAPDRLTREQIQALTLCQDHREELTKASKTATTTSTKRPA